MDDSGINWQFIVYFTGCLVIGLWLPEAVPAFISYIKRRRSNSLIGRVAIADTDLSPEGFVRINERLYFARILTGRAPIGSELRILKRKRDLLEVEIVDT
jgi:membrane-bound ClpP family serine protease